MNRLYLGQYNCLNVDDNKIKLQTSLSKFHICSLITIRLTFVPSYQGRPQLLWQWWGMSFAAAAILLQDSKTAVQPWI